MALAARKVQFRSSAEALRRARSSSRHAVASALGDKRDLRKHGERIADQNTRKYTKKYLLSKTVLNVLVQPD